MVTCPLHDEFKEHLKDEISRIDGLAFRFKEQLTKDIGAIESKAVAIDGRVTAMEECLTEKMDEIQGKISLKVEKIEERARKNGRFAFATLIAVVIGILGFFLAATFTHMMKPDEVIMEKAMTRALERTMPQAPPSQPVNP